MARTKIIKQQNITATGIQPVIVTEGAERVTYQVVMTGSASVRIEVSNDGVNWQQLSNETANAVKALNPVAAQVRANVTITSGTVDVVWMLVL